jgi:hypothetical protein
VNRSKAEMIVMRLLSNVAGLQFGNVSVTVKIHNGRIMDVTHTVTESMKESVTKDAEHEKSQQQAV